MSEPLDRRRFLQSAGAIALTSSLLAGCLSSARRTGSDGTGPPGSGRREGHGPRRTSHGPGPQHTPHSPQHTPHSPGPGPGHHDSDDHHHGSDDHHHGSDDHHHGPRTASPNGTERRDGNGSLAQWFDDVDNYAGVVDRTGQSTVTVRVGARGNDGYFAFDPPAVRVSTGTTVRWEWTGDGGAHDVVSTDGTFASDLTADADATFSHTFESAATSLYYCTPHRSLGMKGAVVVV